MKRVQDFFHCFVSCITYEPFGGDPNSLNFFSFLSICYYDKVVLWPQSHVTRHSNCSCKQCSQKSNIYWIFMCQNHHFSLAGNAVMAKSFQPMTDGFTNNFFFEVDKRRLQCARARSVGSVLY